MQHVVGRVTRATLPISTDWLIAGIFFLLAAGLRVWGVQWSLPFVVHADEAHIVDLGVAMVKSGDLNPHWAVYPALMIYLQAAIYKLNLIWGTWQGFYVGPESLPDHNHTFALAPGVYLWGRTFSALVGGVTVAGLYKIGQAGLGRGVGLVAALLLLTSPLHIENSHYLMTDALMAAWGVAALAAAWGFVQKPQMRRALLAGATVGLCASAKYNGAYVALVPATAWALAWWRGRGQKPSRPVMGWLGLAGGMALAAAALFLLTNPFLILDWKYWSRSFLFEVNDYQAADSLPAMLTVLRTYIEQLWGTEPIIILAGLFGGALLLVDAVRRPDPRRRAAVWLLVPFPLLYVVAMSRFQRVYERNLLIIVPFLCVLGGYGAWRVARWLAGQVRPPAPAAFGRPVLLAGLAGLLLCAEPGRQMINYDRFMAAPDSRNLAAAWLRDEVRAGHRAAVELHPLSLCAPAPWACPLPDIAAPFARVTDHPPQWYADRGYDYVMLLGKEIAQLDDPTKNGPRDPAQLAPYLALPEVRHFAGDDEGGKGPPILVYRVGPGVEALLGVTRSGAHFGDLAELWGSALAPLPTTDTPFDPAATLPVPGTPAHPGAALGVNLYWRALQDGAKVPGNWTVAVHLVDGAGAVVAQVDVQPISSARLRPAREWVAGEFLAGSYPVPLPATLPPGLYHLHLILYDAPTGPTLPVTLGTAAPTPDLDLGPVTVTRGGD